MRIMVTGGAGFIGVNFIRTVLRLAPDVHIVNFDALTYAGNLASLCDIEDDSRYTFVRGEITDRAAVRETLATHAPEIIINFAAESHVDRSILDATVFIQTNILGTQVLLDAAREAGTRRFCQVSTDEVYGSLGTADPAFTEATPIQPNSPYAAAKASADLLVRSAIHTHGMDAVITRCSNNYGPYQFPEKFIPLFIANAQEDKALPLYGDGKNVRDWIHVDDHCTGVWAAATQGKAGEVYNFGCDNEWENIDIAKLIVEILGKPESLIQLVKDRPGHDRRYAMGFAKAARELGWSPQWNFADGLRATIAWYQEQSAWLADVRSGAYQQYYAEQYGER